MIVGSWRCRVCTATTIVRKRLGRDFVTKRVERFSLGMVRNLVALLVATYSVETGRSLGTNFQNTIQ